MWRDREWRKTRNLIDHLPSWSFYNEARANDEEIAAFLADKEAPERQEKISDWSPEVGLLAAIYDRLGQVMDVLVRVNGGEKLKLEPLPRPVSAIQRARELNKRERWKSFAYHMTHRDGDEE